MVSYADGQIGYVDPGFDVNHDDYALELVTATRAPVFQLIIDEDYKVIHINTILTSNQRVMVLKDGNMAILSQQEASKRENKLDRIFKYPSYVSQGKRD